MTDLKIDEVTRHIFWRDKSYRMHPGVSVEDSLDDFFTKITGELESRTLPPWIPVSERLPEEERNYLTANVGGAVNYDWLYEGDEWLCEYGGDPNDVVTHWMPLPEPPRSQQGSTLARAMGIDRIREEQ